MITECCISVYIMYSYNNNKCKILSAETVLSAHTHTRTGTHTHERTDYTKFIHNLKTGSKQRLEIHEDSSMKSTFDPEYEINGTFQHEVNDFKFFLCLALLPVGRNCFEKVGPF